MKSNHMLGASFFCSRSLPECRSVGKIIPSIAYQLAQRCLPFRYALCEKMKSNPDAVDGVPNLQFESLILGPLSDPKVQEALSATVVVIDALDECEDPSSTQQILDVLSIKSQGLPIKFVVSSRPEAMIRDQMQKNGSWVDARVVLHELDTGEVQTDIRTYLKAELAPTNPSQSEIEKLVERAGVLFIYAATVVRYVGRDNFKGNSHARLRTVLDTSKPQGKVQTKDIDQLYGTILEAAVNNDELEETERDDMKLILNTVEMTVTTLHASFPDYLTDPKRSGNSDWHCDAAAHNHLLAERCFECIRDTKPQFNICQLESSFLNDEEVEGLDTEWHCDAAAHNHLLAERCFECIRDTKPQFNICQLESSYLDDDEVEGLDARVQRYITVELCYACLYWPLCYACLYWPVHLGASDSAAAQTLMMLLEQFLAHNLLLWMEVRNLTKNIATSPGDLTTAKQWATDAWRFAMTVVSSPVSQSTPHIYVSMLPFLPSHSPIRKHYAHRMHGMIGVDGTALDRRKALLARWSFGMSNCAACSRDGTLVAIAPSSSDARVSLVDATSGQLVRDLHHDDVGGIEALAFSPDGARVASGTFSGVIWVWEVGSGQIVLGPLEGHLDSIRSIVFSHNGTLIISGSHDDTIRIWGAHSGQPMFSPLVGHTNRVTSIAISSDDTKIISGSWDRTIRVWDMLTSSLVLNPIAGHTDYVNSVAISPNDKFVISGSYDYTVRVWDCLTGQILLGPLSHTSYVSSIAISPDGTFISAGLDNGTIQIWDATTGKAMSQPLKEHSHVIKMLAYSSDGTRIISYSNADSTLCLFDAQSATVALGAFSGHTASILSIDISPDGKHLVSGSIDETLCVWDVVNGKLILGPLTGHTKAVHFVQYSPDGNRILSCSWDRTLLQWDTQTGDSIQVKSPIVHTTTPLLNIRNQIFASATYSPDCSFIASISSRGMDCIWDSITGEMVVGPIQGKTQGQSVMFSANGTTLFTGWKDGAVQAWGVKSSQLISSTQPAGYLEVSAFAFSSDRLYNVVALSSHSGPTMYQRNTQTGEQTPGSFTGHTRYITSVQFSSDGTCIVSGAQDQTVHIWDAQTGTSIFGPLKGHTDWVQTVTYSPESTYVASASLDKTIRIWDAGTQPNSSPFIEWVLNEDGWAMDGKSQRLIWVPPDLRTSLMSPRNTMLLSRDGYLRLNFDGALIGKEWASCRLKD
ncbi:hypothetical protein RSAG8_13001, partial [Rhizoctonia solani AG-8 WAC10335]